ncbi:TasA family protein [Sinomonas sp. R1AF57]|uniref:TasA family protein n=1 Tax=Sinomonas sp. R1AF57 TaxID=2020377 RepID=UPI000B619F5B|nr:TasA family protein [Sinomonas sp. R1AF57]ASN52619.1 hypothetical protein CGQ25_11455 [Sinomonas sp. R1AF57]
MDLSLKSTSGKLLASAALLGVTASIAGLGTYGAFTSTTSADTSVSSGSVTIALGAAGADNRLSVAATGIVPGDTIQRAVTLSNAGDQNLARVALTTTATTSSKLDTDPANGLQIAIDNCSAPWTESGTAPAYTYTCSGSTTSVLATRAVLGSDVALANLASLTKSGTDHLRVTLSLPTAADNSFQGLTSKLNLLFTGTQRSGTNQ